jgi:hypothetical protein
MKISDFKKRLEGIPDESKILMKVRYIPEDECAYVTVDLQVRHNGCLITFFERKCNLY